MTHDKRQATNRLTGESIAVPDYIYSLVKSDRLDVLEFLDEKVGTPSAIHDSRSISRQTASKHLIGCTERGLAKPANSQAGYKLTAGGKLVLDAAKTCLAVIERDQLSYLTSSTHALELLQSLSGKQTRPRSLVDSTTGSPSRTTVQRILQMFMDAGWSSSDQGAYQRTQAGSAVFDAYEELAMTIEHVMAKAPWLQRLGPERADVPVEALPDADVVVSGPDSPGIVLGHALDLCDVGLSRFRALTSIFNPTLFRAYNTLLKLGLPGEAIVDQSVYTHLHDAELEHYLDDSDYKDFRIGHLDNSLTLGIGLYGEGKVAIGAYNEVGEGDHIAMLISSNDDLVDWGTALYDYYRAKAFPAAASPPSTER